MNNEHYQEAVIEVNFNNIRLVLEEAKNLKSDIIIIPQLLFQSDIESSILGVSANSIVTFATLSNLDILRDNCPLWNDDSLKFMRILKNAKSIISIGAQSLSTWFPLQFSGNSNVRYLRLNGIYTQSSNSRLFGFTLDTNSGTKDEITVYTITTSGVTLSSTENISSLRVEYSNDTEII